MENLTSTFSADFSWMQLTGIVLVALVILALIFRIFKRKCIELSHGLSAALSILFLVLIAAVADALTDADLSSYLASLPFVTIGNGWLSLFPFHASDVSAISYQLLSMIVLAFCVNLYDTFLPRSGKLFTWILNRILSIALAAVTFCAVMWLVELFLPEVMVVYASQILLGLLVLLLLLGIVKFLLGLMLTVANPILGAIYAFFFSNRIGKQLSKAVLTTGILAALVLLLHHFGYDKLPMDAATLPAYIPVTAVLLVIWYLTGQIA